VYDACDVFALLPIDEPFGMVFPEAAARGLLLIGPNHGGPMEIMDAGRVGWAVDAFSPEALADALHKIWTLSDAEVQKRRQAARNACVDRYSRKALWPQLRRLLERAH
jgi:glycosyltransferase involved in cell wall biosynthesis